MKTKHILLAISAIFPIALRAQSTFQDLNFESADLSPIPPGQYGGFVSVTSALPGWTAYLGGSQVSQVTQNNVSLGAASIDILGPYWGMSQPGIIDGSYTVYLQPGSTQQGTGSLTASIAQAGLIPSTAQTLIFDAWQPLYSIPFTISFDGTDLIPVVLSTAQSPSGQSYNVYGVDIAPYANESGPLEFTVYPNNYNSLLLDDISFSTTALAPEPSPLILTAISGILLSARKVFLRRS